MLCGDISNPDGQGLKSNGDPCNNPVVPGMLRCYMHGGKMPLAKIKAENMLALLRMPAIEVLHKALASLEAVIDAFNGDTCATCGRPTGETKNLVKACSNAARVASTVLDRTGVGPRATIEIKQTDGDLDPKLLLPAERQELVALLAQVKAVKQRVRDRVQRVVYEQPSAPGVM